MTDATDAPRPVCAVVVVTTGRPSLAATLGGLAAQDRPGDALVREVVVVDDRPLAAPALDVAALLPGGAPWPLRVLRSGGRGRAAARNVGWRSVRGERTPWVCFLDDEVVLPRGWAADLAADLADVGPDVAGVRAEGPEETAGVAADVAYRYDALAGVGGFDERFPRASREDADLALRLRGAGRRLALGRRRAARSARPADGGGLSRGVAVAGAAALAAVTRRVARTVRRLHPEPWPPRVRAVLLDRDGTLVAEVPQLRDPDAVRPLPGARAALDRLRDAGVAVGVLAGRADVATGAVSAEEAAAVDARVDELLGPFDVWRHCPHTPDAGCPCRPPGPGTVLDAARDLGVAPYACAVVGDAGADMGAAVAAGARGVLVPTALTRDAEVAAAPAMAGDLGEAVDLLLAAARGGERLVGVARPPVPALRPLRSAR
ncbi:MAG: HAD-IIIA family hydrolase [Actinomycetales bacterium]|nr:HAD-IIIA family hydrolase [Actinomycetales bacterium]